MQQQKAGYFKAIKILHLALLLGQCIFLGVMFFLVLRKTTPAAGASLNKTLQVVSLLFTFGAVFVSTTIFNKRLLSINDSITNTAEKAAQYRAANIVRWMMVECASFFCVVCFYLTGNYAFAALAAALIIFFALTAPSRLKTMLQLKLSEQEADAL